MHIENKKAYYIGRIPAVGLYRLRSKTSGGYVMASKRGNCRIRTTIAQFRYDHRKMEGHMEKIRKNAAELGRFLDSMPPKKGEKEEK